MTKIIQSHTPLQAANSIISNFQSTVVLLINYSLQASLFYKSGEVLHIGINLVSLQQEALLRIKSDLKSFSVIFTYIKTVVKWDAVTLK